MSDNYEPQSDPIEVSPNGLHLIKRAACDGATDAREAATRFATAASLFASRFVYTTTYTISYGVVFPATLLARSVPRENAAVRGLIDGARAASEKVNDVLNRQATSDTAGLAPVAG